MGNISNVNFGKRPHFMAPDALSILWPALLPAKPRIILASSGGADSLGALIWLHYQKQFGQISDVRVVSINHQIHPDSAEWSALAAAQARHFGFKAEIISVRLPQRSPEGHQSLEARARAARYAALRDYLAREKTGAVLVTAHHLSDQVETFLLAALRGSSLAGLAAMPALAPFGAGWHWRPFIQTPAVALQALAQGASMPCVVDPSNFDTRFDRNFLRHNILPLLQARFPHALEGLSHTAEQASHDWTMLTELAGQDSGAPWGDTLALTTLASLSSARQANLIRGWVKAQGALMPPKTKLNEFMRQCHTAHPAQRPTLRWGDWAITRYRQHLYWRTPVYEAGFEPVLWVDKRQPCLIHANLALTLTRAEENDPLALDECWLSHPWRIRPRAPQDRLNNSARQPTQDLKHWFQQNNMPPWLRASVMMLEINHQLAGMVGLITQDYYQAKAQPGWRITIKKIENSD
jgi:tRNA(Ile)-lysidine synthase